MPKKLTNALTPLAVKNAKPGRHADGGGLYLLVKEGGAKSWVFRFMLKGKTRDVGLSRCPEALELLRGRVGDLTLAQARDVAAIYRMKVKLGIDPLAERDLKAAEALAAAQAAKVAGITFKAAAEDYIKANEGSWRNKKHRQQWRNTLATYVYPVVGELPVADVGTAHVLQIIEPIWASKAETASRIRGRIETILDAAKARGYREGENPARWRGHIAQILPARAKLKRGHHPALPYERVPAFFEALAKRQASAGQALEFTVLTAARTSEVLEAKWEEVDLTKAVWIVPAERMKAGKEHRVPLSPRAVEILKVRRALGDDYLFTGKKGGKLSGMAMAMLIRRMHKSDVKAGGQGWIDPRMKRLATPHGFRSSFRDWADERTAYPHEMKEMALAHTIENKAEKAYRRGDLFEKRRSLMADWMAWCTKNSDGFTAPSLSI